MSAVIGALRVNLGLNSAQFQRGLSQSQSGMQKFANAAKAGFAAISAASAAAFVAIQGRAEQSADAWRQANIAGAGVEEFQRLAHGAKVVGVESEKLADIYKDVNDKVGDFIQTGGGPMADFFENIAPQVGLTADEFARLSGPEALQAYYGALEKANLTQAETTFYMEAIASDATALIPLLRNGGEAFKEFGDEAERLGVVLGEDAVRQGMLFTQNMNRLTQTMNGLWNRVFAKVIPSFVALTNQMVAASQQGGFLDQAVNGISVAMNIAARAISLVFDNLKHLYDLFKIFVAAKIAGFLYTAVTSFIALAKAVRVAGLSMLLLTKVSRAQITVVLLLAAALAKATGKYEDMVGWLENMSSSLMNALPESVRNGINAVTGEIAGLGEAITSADLSTNTMMNRMVDMADNAASSFGSLGAKGRESFKQLAEAGKSVFEATRTPLEQFNAKMQELNTLLQAGVIDWDTYQRAVKMAQDQLDAADKKADGLGDKFKDMFKSIGAGLRGIIDGSKNWLDVLGDIMMNLAQIAFSNINFGGGFGGIIGSLISGLFGFPSFDGGGYTGDGPRTGGLDGIGGRLALVHPQETIIDHTKGQRLAGGNVKIDQTFVLDGAIDGQRIQQMIQQGTAQSVETVKRAFPGWQVEQQRHGAVA